MAAWRPKSRVSLLLWVFTSFTLSSARGEENQQVLPHPPPGPNQHTELVGPRLKGGHMTPAPRAHRDSLANGAGAKTCMRLKALPGPTVTSKQTLRLSTLGPPPAQSRLSLAPFHTRREPGGKAPASSSSPAGVGRRRRVGRGRQLRRRQPPQTTAAMCGHLQQNLCQQPGQGLPPAGDQRVHHRVEQI